MEVLLFLAKRFWWQRGLSRSAKVMQGMVWLGIFLSVTALSITLSVAHGFEREYKKYLLDFNSHLLIHPTQGGDLTREKIEEALKRANLPEGLILNLSPYLLREGLLIHQEKIKGVILKGVDPSTHFKNPPSGGRDPSITLGETLANQLGLLEGPGEQGVKLLVPKGKDLSDKNVRRLKVAGTFQSGLHEIDSQFALIPLNDLQNLYDLDPSFHGFEIRLNDPDRAEEVGQILSRELGPLYPIESWEEINQPLFEALQLEKFAFWILIGLMVFVATLNLIGSVLLAIFRKKKTIAILKALGMEAKEIRKLLAAHGFFLGGLGIFSGLLTGAMVVVGLRRFSWIEIDPEVYFLEKLPLAMDLQSFFIIAVSSLLLVWLVSWAAAKTVSILPIREGLHGP